MGKLGIIWLSGNEQVKRDVGISKADDMDMECVGKSGHNPFRFTGRGDADAHTHRVLARTSSPWVAQRAARQSSGRRLWQVRGGGGVQQLSLLLQLTHLNAKNGPRKSPQFRISGGHGGNCFKQSKIQQNRGDGRFLADFWKM